MGYSFFTMAMMRTSLYLSLATWMAISFPLVDAAVTLSSSGNCSQNEFWYEPVNDCIPYGVQVSARSSPLGEPCPSNKNWYWSNRLSRCLPSSPELVTLSSDPVGCLAHYTWNATAGRCTRAEKLTERSTFCDASEFWFADKSICLPRRNVTSTSIKCPSGWYWSAQLNSCVPTSAEVMLSSSTWCTNGYVWSRPALICQRALAQTKTSSTRPSSMTSRSSTSLTPSRRPTPSPSLGKHSRRHALKSRTLSLCPAGLDACPILKSEGLSDFECVDSKYDLEHCGGCSTDGRGEDCTAIRGAWNVECMNAHCSVLTCMAGYILSFDRKTCINL